MDRNNVLPLLGLALRGGNLIVGEEPVEMAARVRAARLLLLARDAAEGTRRRAVYFAEEGQCLCLPLPFTKAELGRAVGRNAAAIVAVTDIGLANAVVRRLADLDPAGYGEAAIRLELKAKRAAERRAAAHVKRPPRHKPKRPPLPEPPPAPMGKAPRHTDRRPGSVGRSPYHGEAPLTEAPPRPARHAPPPPPRENRPKSRAYDPYAHSRPVKKGKGRKRQG